MKKVIILLSVILLAGCAHANRNVYDSNEAGQVTVVKFGTLLAAREVDITGENTGAGAAIGIGSGALAGAGIGHTGLGVLAGALIGGIAGAVAEQAVNDRTGYEYTVTLENGTTITVTQNKGDNSMLEPGTRVMVQMGGRYSRVLPASALPTKIARPKGIAVQSDAPKKTKHKKTCATDPDMDGCDPADSDQ